MKQLAELLDHGFVVALLQPRGSNPDGVVNHVVFRQYETRQRRVAVQIATLSAYLGDAPESPVLLVAGARSARLDRTASLDDRHRRYLEGCASGSTARAPARRVSLGRECPTICIA